MKLNPNIEAMPGAVYSRFAKRLAVYPGETYPLHIGDTWMDPAVGCRMCDVRQPGVHRYSSVHGLPVLLESLAARVSRVTGLDTPVEAIQVTAGATAGLTAAVAAMLEPGDEVIILAPAWPLVGGAVRALGGKVVNVPFVGAVDSPETAVEAVERHITPRTVAVYWNTPNNPTGLNIPASWLVALTEMARRHDLWILADEVYDQYVYEGVHTYSRPLAPERTIAAYSFSKAYGMAGNRVGYLVGPPAFLDQVRKVCTHTFYSTPTAGQIAAERALGQAGDTWVAQAREAYLELGRYAAARLGVPAPQGSTFLFLDVKDQLDDTGLDGLLEKAVDRGLLVAPGATFGPYPNHVRVCFTSAPPPRVRAGVDVLAELLGR